MADPQAQGGSLMDLLAPLAIGAGGLAAGFAAGRNPAGGDNPGATFLQIPQALSLIEQRQANAAQNMAMLDYYKNLATHQRAQEAQQRQDLQLRQQEADFKAAEMRRKAEIENENRRALGLPEVPLAAYGLMQAPATSLPQAQGQAQATMQAPQSQAAAASPTPNIGSGGPAATVSSIPQPPQGFRQKFEMGPQGVTRTFEQIAPQDEVGKIAQDYSQFLIQNRGQESSPQFKAVDAAFQGKLAQVGRVTLSDPRAKIAQDIALLNMVPGPMAEQAKADLVREYRIQQLHGTPDSTIGKMIKDRAYYVPGSPEYAMFDKALIKETNPFTPDNRMSLINTYIRNSGDFLTVKDNYLQMANAFKDSLANPGSGVNDSTMIFGYMKMVDPSSVVREGEFDRMTNLGGVPAWMRNYFAPDGRLIQGVVLPPEVRAKLVQGASGIYQARSQGQYGKTQLFQQIATQMKMPPTDIVPVTGKPTPLPIAQQALQRANGNVALADAALIAQGYDPNQKAQ